MNKLDSNHDASSILKQVKDTQDVIKNKGIKEYLPWFLWGLFVLITYPSFDFVKSSIWGYTVAIIFIIGMLLSSYYYITVNSRIHNVSHTPWYIALLYFILIFITIFFANVFQSSFHYSWVFSGVILAALFFIYGFYLKFKY